MLALAFLVQWRANTVCSVLHQSFSGGSSECGIPNSCHAGLFHKTCLGYHSQFPTVIANRNLFEGICFLCIPQDLMRLLYLQCSDPNLACALGGRHLTASVSDCCRRKVGNSTRHIALTRARQRSSRGGVSSPLEVVQTKIRTWSLPRCRFFLNRFL